MKFSENYFKSLNGHFKCSCNSLAIVMSALREEENASLFIIWSFRSGHSWELIPYEYKMTIVWTTIVVTIIISSPSGLRFIGLMFDTRSREDENEHCGEFALSREERDSEQVHLRMTRCKKWLLSQILMPTPYFVIWTCFRISFLILG